MRTTIDMIDELSKAAKDSELAGIIVGFETSTIFVWSDSAEPLKLLNECVETGGDPVGLIRFRREENKLVCGSTPFVEYADDEQVRGYIASLMERLRSDLHGDIFPN